MFCPLSICFGLLLPSRYLLFTFLHNQQVYSHFLYECCRQGSLARPYDMTRSRSLFRAIANEGNTSITLSSIVRTCRLSQIAYSEPQLGTQGVIDVHEPFPPACSPCTLTCHIINYARCIQKGHHDGAHCRCRKYCAFEHARSHILVTQRDSNKPRQKESTPA